MFRFIAATVAAFATVLVRRRVKSSFEADFARRRTIKDDGIVQGAEPVVLEGSTTHAVLLLHGFNDTPQSVVTLANALNSKGWTVHAPLLPGHGRSLKDAASVRAESLLSYARAQYEELASRYEHVALVGQSMGGALAVLVAAKHPDLSALVLLAPYLGMPAELQVKLTGAWIAQPVIPYHRSAGGENSIHDPVARKRALGTGVVTAGMLVQLRRIAGKAAKVLPRVKAPTLYLQSREDNRIPEKDAAQLFAKIGANVRKQYWLSGCGHIIAEDYCHKEVAAEVAKWLEEHIGTPDSLNSTST